MSLYTHFWCAGHTTILPRISGPSELLVTFQDIKLPTCCLHGRTVILSTINPLEVKPIEVYNSPLRGLDGSLAE